MKRSSILCFPIILFAILAFATHSGTAQSNNSKNPTWWDKYQYIANNGATEGGGNTASVSFGSNVDVSNECGPQSETFITLNTAKPKQLAAGSNEIFRLPMRGYYSANGGSSWGGVDLPLPPPIGANGIDFGSDPTLAFDTRNNSLMPTKGQRTELRGEVAFFGGERFGCWRAAKRSHLRA